MDRKTRRMVQILTIAAGFAIYGLVWKAGEKEGSLLARNRHGEGTQVYTVEVDGLLEEGAVLEVPVRERQYSGEEASQIFDAVWSPLVKTVLNGNPSEDEVRTDLNLISWWDEYGIEVQWKTDGEVIDGMGSIHNQELPAEGTKVLLEAVLSDGSCEEGRSLELTVFPPELTEEELKTERFLIELSEEDEKQAGEDSLQLPEMFEGSRLSYRKQEDSSLWLLPFMGIGAAVLVEIREAERKKQEKEKRDFMLMRDYPELLSKLAVFLGAGMTVRSSWEQIVRRYERELEAGTVDQRPVYEEMRKSLAEMEQRVPEGTVYQNFAASCGLLPYRKLAGFLEQNRREGMKNLKGLMKAEMESAFEERKNLARKQGEEASAKLLAPLFLMLAVVMAMVMVPALLSF